MNIFKRELIANRKSIIFWCIGILFMVAGGMGKYAGFEASGQSVNEFLNVMPKPILTIMGFANLDLSKASGFYALLYIYLLVMAAIHAAMLGANIIAKEERDKTSEFLYVKPVSRKDIITSKLLASVVNLLIFNFFTLVSSIAIVAKTSKESFTESILLMMLGMLFLQLMFLFIGTGLAAISRKPRAAASQASAFILGSYLIYVIINMEEKLSFLKYLTPFKYFEAESILAENSLNWLFMLISLAVTFLFGWITYHFYQKKDLMV